MEKSFSIALETRKRQEKNAAKALSESSSMENYQFILSEEQIQRQLDNEGVIKPVTNIAEATIVLPELQRVNPIRMKTIDKEKIYPTSDKKAN